MILVNALKKFYGSVLAIDQLSFMVPEGSIFAFLGTNGAGKSTTISCMTTVLPFEEGSITINARTVDKDQENIRKEIGVVFQNSLLDPKLTAQENLEVRAHLYQLTDSNTRMASLARMLNTEHFMHQRYSELSGGQKRRIDIIRALLHKPRVLFLDEPTAGLDPQSREHLWKAVNYLREEENLTVFLTTHYMEETEKASHVFIIDRGKEIAQGTPTELREKYSHTRLKIKTTNRQATMKAAIEQGFSVEHQEHEQTIIVPSSLSALKFLHAQGSTIKDFELRHGTMDDVFLKLVGSETS